MNNAEHIEFERSLRAFLKPTLRGKIRSAVKRVSERLFPKRPVQLYRPGDLVTLQLSGANVEKTVKICRSRFVEFTDGSEMVIS